MVVHLLWVMFDSVRVRKNDVARLKQATYINRVRRDLINAHNNDEFVEHALKAVLNEVRAETVLLASFADRMAEQLYYFPSEDRGAITELFGNHNIHDDFPQFFDRLSDGESILFDMADAPTSISETTAARMRAQGIVNLMMAPIIDNAGLLRGMLCAVNVKPMPKTCELLECVTYDFYMALMNIKNHKIIRHMGEIDYLTDMKNRNSYEAALHTLEVYDCDTLSCVFIDANGLHEINNTQGHKAGDLMLCAVSDEIRRVFGVQYTYRIGGDEFLCFVANADAAKLSEDANTVTAVLAAKGYYVSVGCAERRRDASGKFDVVGVVADAEARMYEEKREYYKRNDLVWERGQKRKNDDCHQSREE